MLVALSLLGAGCSTDGQPSDEEVVPRPPMSCDDDPLIQGYRDPATQACVESPRADQQASFYAFDQLYGYAHSNPTAVTLATIRLDTAVTTAGAASLLASIPSRQRTTLLLLFPTFRDGTSLPLELRAEEGLDAETLLIALRDTIAFRPYEPAEIAELERAFESDAAVSGFVVEAQISDLLSFWVAHPARVQFLSFDLPSTD